MSVLRVGVIGCGAISGAYFGAGRNHPNLRFTACADMNPEAAKKRAAEFGVPRVLSVEELLRCDEVDCVLNLTVPKAHTEVALRAIGAGKHTYAEKPLGIDREEGRRVIDAARSKGVRVGCAPDTFLGAGHQTARKLIDDGAIGRPLAATAFMLCRGHESWHPNPEFYYEVGGGPMFDMGPYYLTALINMLGPIRRVTGIASIAMPERTITHGDGKGGPGPKHGKKIKVETPDHVAGTIEFHCGVVATVVMSFAVMNANYSGATPIAIYGSEGSLLVPDPNGFDGEVKLAKPGSHGYQTVEPTHPKGYARSAGLADLSAAIDAKRPHRVSGDLAFAVLDAMAAFLDSSRTHHAVEMSTQVNRPAALPTGKPFGSFE